MGRRAYVVSGMDDHDRTSYKIWGKGGKAPDFILEVTSKGTVAKDQRQNPLIYRDLDVKEYFPYDPTGEYLKPNSLQGVRLQQGKYVEISSSILPNCALSLSSEVLGLDLHSYSDRGFRFYDPISQQIVRTFAESEQGRFQAELERSLERQSRLQADQAKFQAEEIATQQRLQKEKLAAYLRSLGVDPEQIYSPLRE